MPNWGPDLSSLDLTQLFYYLKPDAKKNATKWEDVPEDWMCPDCDAMKEDFEMIELDDFNESYG
jgi:hypothetical protein